MRTLPIVLSIIAVLQTACIGHRTYTEQEQQILAQTKTIWVDVRSDLRTLPPGITNVIDRVGLDVKNKLTHAGLTVVPDPATADAVLQLSFEFSDRRHQDELSSSNERTFRHDAHSIHIGVSLDHKEVGHVFWHGSSVSPPYDLSLANFPIIRYIDLEVLEALFKSKPPAMKNR